MIMEERTMNDTDASVVLKLMKFITPPSVPTSSRTSPQITKLTNHAEVIIKFDTTMQNVIFHYFSLNVLIVEV